MDEQGDDAGAEADDAAVDAGAEADADGADEADDDDDDDDDDDEADDEDEEDEEDEEDADAEDVEQQNEDGGDGDGAAANNGSGGDDDDDSSSGGGSSSSSSSSSEDIGRPARGGGGETKQGENKPAKKKGGFFSRMMGRKVEESSSSESSSSEEDIDLEEVEAETIAECVEALKIVEEVDSDWDILLDAPSDWDSDDSENKPTAPVFRSTCGYLSIETTQIREDVLRALIDSRQALEDAEKELKMTEDDEYMKYYHVTLGKLRDARDKAAKRVRDEELRLETYSQKDAGAVKLAASLRFNEHLLSLTMCDAEIGPTGATALADAIKVHPALTHLSLKHNPIGPDGAEAIVRASRRNKVGGLQEIDFWDCRLGPEGATKIAAQLHKDENLEEMRLRYNQIGPAGATALASALMDNRTLEKLDLSLNDIQMSGALAFERVLKFTVVADVEKGQPLQTFNKLLARGRKRLEDPFWDDVKRAEPQMIVEDVDAVAADSGLDGGGTSGGDEGDEAGEGKKGREEDKDGGEAEGEGEEAEGEEEVEEDEEEEAEGKAGDGESKTEQKTKKKKKKPKKLSRRARRKKAKEEAERQERIRENKKFWMSSTLYTKQELLEAYEATFQTNTKLRSVSVVLFAGTRKQCTKAVNLFDSQEGLTIMPKNSTVVHVDVSGNNFERAFRQQPAQMKRLFGSQLSVWPQVSVFFNPLQVKMR